MLKQQPQAKAGGREGSLMRHNRKDLNGGAEPGGRGPTTTGLGRRGLLKTISLVPAAALLVPASQTVKPDLAETAAQPLTTGPYQPKSLDAHEWHTVRMLSDLIIPA